MGTKIAEDLAHPAHLSGAEEALDRIEPKKYGLDVIAFVVRALPRGVASILTVMDDETLTVDQVEEVFGATTRRSDNDGR
jgi:antitoxin component HigA of HigAB toxin-antitoxin module